MNTYIKATSDIFIHYLFGSESNKDLLLSFINAVLEDADMPLISNVEIRNPFNLKKYHYDKLSIVDIKATDEKGQIYDIEVQSFKDEFYANRSLYYWAKIYSDQLKEAEGYVELNPVICINLLDFILIKELPDVHTCFLAMEKNNHEYALSNHFKIHFIELPKFYKKHKGLKKHLDKWVQYFIHEGKEDEKMKYILKSDPIKKAHEEYIKFSSNDEYREIYEARLKWQRDHNTRIEVARRDGIAKGKAEGKAEGIAEGKAKGIAEGEYAQAVKAARVMIKKGYDAELINEVTGLSVEEIKNLSR